MSDGAIGIFDSGVGGLTVYKEVAARLPRQPIVYLGDTARVPYGTKSPETVVRYARSCAALLIKRDIDLLVIACNTASAFAMDALREELELPVIGVVEPGARAAVAATRNGRIGVIGTTGTIASGIYPQVIHGLLPDAEVISAACPLFVPLVEEGWTAGLVPEEAARVYLAPMMDAGIDTLVLGCTHYPLLKRVIAQVVGPEVTLVDSASETARVVEETLAAMGTQPSWPHQAPHLFLVSDAPDRFRNVGRHFLDEPLERIEWVDV